jgi:hypothetical protein
MAQVMRTARVPACLLFLIAVFVGIRSTALSADPLDICANFSPNCSCSYQGGGVWEGTCDFSGETNPLEVGAEFCDSWVGECDHWCEVEWPPNSCWLGWASANGCEAGETTEQVCACSTIYWCLE